MKAKYQKPLLAMETFSSTQPTARDCADSVMAAGMATSADSATCKYDLGGGSTIFTTGVAANACTIEGNDMQVYCYNNPSENYYIFHS